MRVAVTGATGSIGNYVLRELFKFTVDVLAVTRRPELLTEFIDQIKIVKFDIADVDDGIYKYLCTPDVLVHLAWGGLPNYKSSDHIKDELPKQVRFIHKMIEGGLGSLLVTGTCFEYGMKSGCLEENEPTNPRTPYAIAKNELRVIIHELKQKHTFNYIWARLFYMYGEGQSSSSIYSQLATSCANSEEFFNMSGGDQIRDYLPVQIVAEKIVRLALINKDIGVVNVCSGTPVALKETVEERVERNGWKIKLNLGYYPYLDYEPMSFWGSNIKFNKLFR